MRLRSKALQTALGLSYHVRAPSLWDFLTGVRCTILMYHGVPARSQFDDVVNHYGYNVPNTEFERHLDYLQQRCNVISLRDLLAEKNLSRSKTNVVITFDDGYENNCTNAFAELSRRGLPAVFALPTAFAPGREPLYNDVVEYGIHESERDDVQFRWEEQDVAFSLRDFGGRLSLYNWLMHHCVQIDQARRQTLIETALQALEVSVDSDQLFENDDYRPMTEEQIARMAESDLVEFASHSVHHYLLAKASSEQKRVELDESKREIERITGSPCTAFCVPGGSYDDEMLEFAFELGYECVLTSDVGTVRPGQRVFNRNGVFHRDVYWFADVVHGPVYRLLGATRRAKHTFAGVLKNGGAQ